MRSNHVTIFYQCPLVQKPTVSRLSLVKKPVQNVVQKEFTGIRILGHQTKFKLDAANPQNPGLSQLCFEQPGTEPNQHSHITD